MLSESSFPPLHVVLPAEVLFFVFLIPVDLSIPRNSTSCQMFGMHTFVILFKEAKITGYSSLSAGYCALLTLPWHTKVTRQVEQDEVDGGHSPFWNGEQQC